MSYKEEMKKEIQNILNHHESKSKNLYLYIEKFYEKALYESKKTGHSIESITYEILEGLEECYQAHPHEIEALLKNCSILMVNVIHTSAHTSLEKKSQKIIQAKRQLIETLETEKSYLLETLHTFQNYAKDNTHPHFQESLHQTESDIIEKICILSDYIKEYVEVDEKEIHDRGITTL